MDLGWLESAPDWTKGAFVLSMCIPIWTHAIIKMRKDKSSRKMESAQAALQKTPLPMTSTQNQTKLALDIALELVRTASFTALLWLVFFPASELSPQFVALVGCLVVFSLKR